MMHQKNIPDLNPKLSNQQENCSNPYIFQNLTQNFILHLIKINNEKLKLKKETRIHTSKRVTLQILNKSRI